MVRIRFVVVQPCRVKIGEKRYSNSFDPKRVAVLRSYESLGFERHGYGFSVPVLNANGQAPAP